VSILIKGGRVIDPGRFVGMADVLIDGGKIAAVAPQLSAPAGSRTIQAEELSVVKGDPVKIFAPGEYSARGVAVLGFSSARDAQGGAERGQNTIFLFETEEMRLCFLGALGAEPAPETIERLSGVDILFVPAGDGDTLPVNMIDDLVRRIEPKAVIPMHYKITGMTTTLPDEKPFCKVMGNCPKETLPKWNVKKKDLEGKNLEVVLLAKSSSSILKFPCSPIVPFVALVGVVFIEVLNCSLPKPPWPPFRSSSFCPGSSKFSIPHLKIAGPCLVAAATTI
jgi:hypothetical protein